MEQYFLVEFEYEHYCQGYEWVTTMLLVKAPDFEHACTKIYDIKEYENACAFVNKTL